MNKKILLPLVTLVLFVFFVTLGILQYRSQRAFAPETTPLIPAKTVRAPRPAAEITQTPGIPTKVDPSISLKSIPDDLSFIEKDKIFDSLPLRTENFSTSTSLKTTINIYSFDYDPASSIRLEIYGINYNDSLITGPNAIAFKESFLEAKKQLTSRGAVLKNLQIIYGNRQYIQDTATYWIKTFKLLE